MTYPSFACGGTVRTLPGLASSFRTSNTRVRILGRCLRIGSLAVIRTVCCKKGVEPFLIHLAESSFASAGHRKTPENSRLSLTRIKFRYRLATKVHPPPPRANHSIANLNIRSQIHYSAIIYVGLCMVTAISIASCVSVGDDYNQKTANVESASFEDMAVQSAIAPGHHGNLTLEQEMKLRKFWDAILGVCHNNGADIEAADRSPPGQSAAEFDGIKKKRGFGFFKGPSELEASTSRGHRSTGSLDDNKYSLTKQFQEILASQKPEDIREALWGMMKHDHPDALVLRFLRARKWNIDQALVMLISAVNWRHSKMKVDQDIMKNGEAGAADDEKNGDMTSKKLGADFLKQCRSGKSFLHGIDKAGRPICVVKARLHKADEQSLETLERHTVYTIETTRLVLMPPVDTANIIFDMTGFTLANMDYHSVKFMIQCFEANYPESLGVVLVHNAPWLFQGIWRIIRGWLDPIVAAKVHFTNNSAGLREFIQPERIIKDLDGDEDWTYKYQEPIEGENDRIKDSATRSRLLKERQDLYAQFENNTRRWINHPDGEEAQEIKAERENIASKLRDGYWRLDPYIRARSLYDRQGIIRPNGDVVWYHRDAKGSDDNTEKKTSLTQ